MAERITLVSDLSGTEILDPKEQASMTIAFADKRRGEFHLDLTKEEANEFAEKGAKVVAV